MIPAAIELLMRRLRTWDRKALHGAAMICAEVWNSAGKTIDPEKRPEPFSAQDFLPVLPEERARREAEKEAERTRPVDLEQFAQFKAGLVKLTKKKS